LKWYLGFGFACSDFSVSLFFMLSPLTSKVVVAIGKKFGLVQVR